jgi:Alr-MurF fusion protein
MIKFSQLQDITGGQVLGFYKDLPISALVIDSRKAVNINDSLFFAIKGERHDGHAYIMDLYEQGLRQFVVEENPRFPLPQCNILKVSSSVSALQQIAATHRRQFNIPVIGITGSNGKTIIKEWLFQMLSKWEVVVKNPGSYNSQVGVPLSVWQLQRQHTLGIFEAGISRPGEMKNLEQVIAPTIGIFTNIGTAHDEGFVNHREKALEKLKLFRNTKQIVFCSDHSLIKELIAEAGLTFFAWGYNPDADLVLKKISDFIYSCRSHEQQFSLTLPFDDKASVENCFHAIALMVSLGYNSNQIQAGVNTLKSVPMRLELKEGINQCQIIDDTYNNDLAGLEISLQFLSHQHQKKKKTVILSDILETGLKESELIRTLEALILRHSVNRFIGIGPLLSNNEDFFPEDSAFFTSTADFLDNFDTNTLHNEIILVKGARTFEFEKIVRRLQRKVHGTVMEIDLGALVHNFNFIKSTLKKSTKIMVMVKAFAYGSGGNEVANLLQYHQADYLGVAYADEGVELRKNNITLPIMVMNPSVESFEQCLQYHLEPEIFSHRTLHSLVQYLHGKPCRIHIKIDTGMHRLGFDEEDLNELILVLKQHKNLSVASIFSHLAGADEEKHDDFSREQAEHFKMSADRLSNELGYRPLYHILNSPGILRLPEFQFDMVRLGIGLYGIDPTDKYSAALKPVATLKTVISQIKTIKQGESVGYGRRGVALKETVLATIALGYADGFSRAFSRGVGQVLINGKKAKVIGNVCMDMTMVDITGIPAHEGDEVIIFGKDLPIQDVAQSIDTIAYEILTNTSERVKRVFVAESI